MSWVDGLLSAYAGVTHSDLPDCPYRDWYEAGWHQSQAAYEALAEAGAPVEVLDRMEAITQ